MARVEQRDMAARVVVAGKGMEKVMVGMERDMARVRGKICCLH